MDILDILADDHLKLQAELVEMDRLLSQSGFGERFHNFVEAYLLHESIEEEVFFPALSAAGPCPDDLKGAISACQEAHREIWELLGKVVDCLNLARVAELRKAFFDFSALAEMHIEQEERLLFHWGRRHLDESLRDELGQAAEEKLRTAGSQTKKAVKSAFGLA